jgi:hypothetical protein
MKEAPQKITQDEILELKDIYKGKTLFKTTINGRDFVFRLADYYDIMQVRQELQSSSPEKHVDPRKLAYERYLKDPHLMILEYCLLWPKLKLEDFIQMPNGLAYELSYQIQQKSGFVHQTVDGKVLGPVVGAVRLTEGMGWDSPTQEEIDQVNSQYSSTSLHLISIDGKYYFIVKPLTVQHTYQVAQAIDETLATYQHSVVWPTNVEPQDVPLGVMAILENKINKISAYDTADVTVEEI